MLVVKDHIGKTLFEQDTKRIISTYKGRVNKEISLVHLEKVAKFYQQNEVHTAIIDLREIYGSFVKILSYLGESFYPMAIKSGLKAQAFVITDDLIIKNLTKKIAHITDTYDVQARTFATCEEAAVWLDTF